jgi:hypothetical protein
LASQQRALMNWLKQWFEPYQLEYADVHLGECLMYDLAQIVNDRMGGAK